MTISTFRTELGFCPASRSAAGAPGAGLSRYSRPSALSPEPRQPQPELGEPLTASLHPRHRPAAAAARPRSPTNPAGSNPGKDGSAACCPRQHRRSLPGFRALRGGEAAAPGRDSPARPGPAAAAPRSEPGAREGRPRGFGLIQSHPRSLLTGDMGTT